MLNVGLGNGFVDGNGLVIYPNYYKRKHNQIKYLLQQRTPRQSQDSQKLIIYITSWYNETLMQAQIHGCQLHRGTKIAATKASVSSTSSEF
jgi:hypothetical protein